MSVINLVHIRYNGDILFFLSYVMPSLLSNLKWWINICASPIGIILNAILLYLIKNKFAPNLVDYKKVLYLGCTTDLISGIWYFLTNPDPTFIAGVYIVFTRGAAGYLPFPWAVWTWPFTVLILYFSFINVWIQFVYRFFLVWWRIKLNGSKFFCLFLIGFNLVSAHPIYEWYHLIVRIRRDQDFAPLLNDTDWIINGKLPPFAAFSMRNDGPNEDHLITFGHMQTYKIVYIIFAYITIFISGICIFLKIRKDENLFSTDAKKYQRQISIVMTVEGTVPLFTMVLPMLFDLMTIVTGIRIPWAGTFSLMLVGMAPIINPIVKIFVISCYRKWIFKVFGIKKQFTAAVVVTNGTVASSKISNIV